MSRSKRKPLKLQTSITTSIVAFDDVFVRKVVVVVVVDDNDERRFCSVIIDVIGSILVLVSS